jgi:hypothetical protein
VEGVLVLDAEQSSGSHLGRTAEYTGKGIAEVRGVRSASDTRHGVA